MLRADKKTRIGSWNVCNLSSNRKSQDLIDICEIIQTNFDVIALQECRDDSIVQKLVFLLNNPTDKVIDIKWNAVISERVGSSARWEVYCFVYRVDKLQVIGKPFIVHQTKKNATEEKEEYVRPPFICYFKNIEQQSNFCNIFSFANIEKCFSCIGCFCSKNNNYKISSNLDFLFVTVHIKWGKDGKKGRAHEIEALNNLLSEIQNACGSKEKDIIIAGDFNTQPEESSWNMQGMLPLIKRDEKNAKKTTMVKTDNHIYDNIWIPQGAMLHQLVEAEILHADIIKSNSLSDHYPVRAVFVSDQDVDEGMNTNIII